MKRQHQHFVQVSVFNTKNTNHAISVILSKLPLLLEQLLKLCQEMKYVKLLKKESVIPREAHQVWQ